MWVHFKVGRFQLYTFQTTQYYTDKQTCKLIHVTDVDTADIAKLLKFLRDRSPIKVKKK